MANMLDEIIGSSNLPHVYCKKITVETSPASPTPHGESPLPPGGHGTTVYGDPAGQENVLNATKIVKVTLNLVLYEKLGSSGSSPSWLKQLTDSSKINKKLKYMYLQVQPITDLEYLKPNVTPAPESIGHPFSSPSTEALGSVYSIDTFLEKTPGASALKNVWYPWHSHPMDFNVPEWTGKYVSPGKGGYIDGHVQQVKNIFYPTLHPEEDNADWLTLLTGIGVKIDDHVSDLKLLPVETINGKSYYALPITCSFHFPIKFKGEQAALWSSRTQNLGFMFYTWMDIRTFVEEELAEIPNSDLLDEFFDKNKIRGPINTEIVYENSKISQKRQEFFLPDGKSWEGSVHLHYTGYNPTPDGYHGRGGLGENTGWMTGEKHIGYMEQSKLTLAEVPNYKIDDFTSEHSWSVHGYTYSAFSAEHDEAIPGSALSPNYTWMKKRTWQADTGRFLENVVAPFQKETRRHLIKDNETEYSKLFLTRGAHGQAKGIFFINWEIFLRNNSNLFGNLSLSGDFVNKAIENSMLLELKVYRSRVKRHNPDIKNQEIFKNDTSFEEPPVLIASIGAAQVPNVGDLLQGGVYSDITLPYQTNFGSINKIDGFGPLDVNNLQDLQRYACFSFTDHAAATLEGGRYQYSIEVKFKDGTYQMIKQRLKDLIELDQDLRRYFELSSGHFSHEIEVNHGPHPGGLTWNTHNTTYEQRKKVFTPWYNKHIGTFHSNFEDHVINAFHHPHMDQTKYQAADGENYRLWEFVPLAIEDTMGLFYKQTGWDSVLSATIISMAHPSHGSPAGIEFFIKIMSSIIDKLQILTNLTKIKSGGSSLTTKKVSAPGLEINEHADPASSVIIQTHSYDDIESLYIATSSKNIWANYLDFSPTEIYSSNSEVKIMQVGQYMDRCHLELSKFITNGPKSSQPANNASLSALPLYSNLSPSAVIAIPAPGHLSSGIESFRGDGSDTKMTFGPTTAYLNLLYTLGAYHQKRKDTEYADIIEPPVSPSGIPIGYRGAAKNFIDDHNITVHSKAKYSEFFDKLSGAPHAVTEPLDAAGHPPYYTTGISDKKYFSDSDVRTDRFISDYAILGAQNISRLPAGSMQAQWSTTGLYVYSLKNAWEGPPLTPGMPGTDLQMKSWLNEIIQELSAGNQLTPHSPLHDAYFRASAFTFFHLNLIKFLQWYSVPPSSSTPAPDDFYWSNINMAFLDQLINSPGKSVLCRMVSPPQEIPSLARTEDISLPVIDKYFIIQNLPDGGYLA